jgi:molybdopterin-guanine dinucleotide biosynthesis protein A
MAGTAILGVILAGGRSMRMGTDKALMPIEGMPLVARVAHRLAPQVARLVVNANGEAARFADCGAGEPGFEHAGPLAGIAAALAFAQHAGFLHVATVPVDAPLLPLDLVARLAAGAANEVAVAAGPNGMEPLFALWPATFAPGVAAAIAGGERAVRRLVQRLPHRLVSFTFEAGEPSPFLNLNTPADAATFARSTIGPPSMP